MRLKSELEEGEMQRRVTGGYGEGSSNFTGHKESTLMQHLPSCRVSRDLQNASSSVSQWFWSERKPATQSGGERNEEEHKEMLGAHCAILRIVAIEG